MDETQKSKQGGETKVTAGGKNRSTLTCVIDHSEPPKTIALVLGGGIKSVDVKNESPY